MIAKNPSTLFALICFVLVAVQCAGQLASASSQTATEPAFTRTVYLIRHGGYETDAKRENFGSLTSLGIAQARLVATRVRGISAGHTSLKASTMARAHQTAEIIQQSLPALVLETTPLLRECTPRTWRADLIMNEKPADLIAAEEQLNEAFAKYFVPTKDADCHDIIVCHGNVIRYFVMKALKVDTQAWLGLSVAHCSLTIVQVTPSGAFKVLAVGDIGHIPPNLQSGLTSVVPQLVVNP